MKRSLPFVALALAAACVTPPPVLDGRGAVARGQRLVVLVWQAPGPWLVADPDNKAEIALKISPLGSFLQGMQEDRVNDLSKEVQPYLPRPRYDQALEAAFVAGLKSSHDGPVQTALEAGITPAQWRDWNKAEDQLQWRRRYFAPDPYGPAPRDYSKILALDDAVILEVNLQFGLEPDEQERALPALTAALRAYRANTTRLLWSREELFMDKTSSMTLSEFRASPSDLTDRLLALSAPLGAKLAADAAAGLALVPPQRVVVERPSGGADLAPSVAPAAPSPAAAPAPLPEAPGGYLTSAPPAPEPAPAPAASTPTAPSGAAAPPESGENLEAPPPLLPLPDTPPATGTP